MKMRRTYKPELISMKDPTRDALHGSQLDIKNARVVATNGHALVSVPVEIEPTIDRLDGRIPDETLEAARKIAKKADVDRGFSKLDARAICTGNDRPEPTPLRVLDVEPRKRPFPPTHHVIPLRESFREQKVVAALNPSLLRDLAEAIDSSDYVALAFDPADPNGPIRVYGRNMKTEGAENPTDPIAVLMPCRR